MKMSGGRIRTCTRVHATLIAIVAPAVATAVARLLLLSLAVYQFRHAAHQPELYRGIA